MKLGFLTAPFPETPLMDVADWAASSGFEVLEIACWPVATGPTRRYAGTSHIDVDKTSASEGKEIVAALDPSTSYTRLFLRPGLSWLTVTLPRAPPL